MAPSVERCSELKNSNEALTRQVQDLQSQIKISKEMHKRAKINAQTEKDEVKRLQLAVARQRAATEVATTAKRQLEVKVEQQDKEVISPSLNPSPVFTFQSLVLDKTPKYKAQGSVEKIKAKIN